ncbi:hypothetical protein EJ02DRAFT_420567 [Clathrospora elynae]|uniref:Uncharacterized protein n=1 Tax=Clathrospora elynae TaxID=706981 RepID=A0A6A5SWG6_9PLEO|nr:hypothetical protein EJ02DRAFT_420567 [Clathrospora elynae]
MAIQMGTLKVSFVILLIATAALPEKEKKEGNCQTVTSKAEPGVKKTNPDGFDTKTTGGILWFPPPQPFHQVPRNNTDLSHDAPLAATEH